MASDPLPKGHVAKLVVQHYHEALAHAAREQALAEVWAAFWIVTGRAVAKDAIPHSVTCC